MTFSDLGDFPRLKPPPIGSDSQNLTTRLGSLGFLRLKAD